MGWEWLVNPQICMLFSCSVASNSLWPHGLQHARLCCPTPSPGACSNSCPSSWWCHPIILSFVIPFSSWLQSFPVSGSFTMSWLFASGGQSIETSDSASIPPVNIQDWFPLGLTGLISLKSKGFSRVFFNTTVQKHQFFSAQTSLWSNSHIRTWLLVFPAVIKPWFFLWRRHRVDLKTSERKKCNLRMSHSVKPTWKQQANTLKQEIIQRL